MDEFKFVIRCFLFSCLLFSLSQIKADGMTFEARIQNFLVSAPVAEFVNNSAHGAVLLIQKSTNDISNMIDGYSRKLNSMEKTVQAPKSKQINTKDIDLSEEEEF